MLPLVLFGIINVDSPKTCLADYVSHLARITFEVSWPLLPQALEIPRAVHLRASAPELAAPELASLLCSSTSDTRAALLC